MNPMKLTVNPSAWNRCVMRGSKSAWSDIKSRCRWTGSSAGAWPSRFDELALNLRSDVSPCEVGCFVPPSAAALPELVARRARREKTLTILLLLGG